MVVSKAVFEPDIDDRTLDREVREAEEKMAELEHVEPDIDTRRMERQLGDVGDQFSEQVDVGGLGGAARGRRGGGMGGGAGFAAGSLLGRGGGLGSIGGALSKAALPVALAGGIGMGILKATETVAKASPAFQQQQEMFSAALQNFRAPFGRFLADQISTANQSLLQRSVEFRQQAEQEGLPDAMMDLFGPSFAQLTSPNAATRAAAGGTIGSLTGGIFGGKIGSAVGGAIGATLGAMPFTDELANVAIAASALADRIPPLEDTIAGFDVDVSGLFNEVERSWPGWTNIIRNWEQSDWDRTIEAWTAGDWDGKVKPWLTDDWFEKINEWNQANWDSIVAEWTNNDWNLKVDTWTEQLWSSKVRRWEKSDWGSKIDPINQSTWQEFLESDPSITGSDDTSTSTSGTDGIVDSTDDDIGIGGSGGGIQVTPGGSRVSTDTFRSGLSVSPEGFGLEGDQRGGLVTRSGATVVHRGEAIIPEREIERFMRGAKTGTDVDLSSVESKLDELIRSNKKLRDALNMVIEVDGERLGRVVTTAQQRHQTLISE